MTRPSPVPSAAFLAAMTVVGGAVWLAAFISAGVATFLVAVICLGAGLACGYGVADVVAENRSERQIAAMHAYSVTAHDQAQQWQKAAAGKERELYQARADLREAESELAMLRAQAAGPDGTQAEGDEPR
ncbi:hypothetical protein [Nonomuraea wenchangensis]|uniref:Uncharacterized protein n=1 Tax=Nonomuraea wenchangensis TaxID=568860 RepID=A0A1I0LV90_9ACTN|nr:hypothetical protein [Nonomuraea wenchangensis]SEU46403.1 hypothetical protein SAMN05421811_12724 [Nonomuraea wenchangensis]